MKFLKSQISNIIFLVVIALLVIPQTRKPIQVFISKGMALISPSIEKLDKQELVSTYDWQLKDESGDIFNFESTKGKVVIINFWATWCPPCIAEMPSLQKLYNDYHDRVEFLFVTNDPYIEINKFLEKEDYTFKVFRPLKFNSNVFNVTSIPRTFLIDNEGHIVIDESGAANWNSESVREIIDELLQ